MSKNVVFSRTVTPHSGHLADATRFARKRIAAIEKECGVKVSLMSRLGGPAGQLTMISYHKDVNEIEKIRRKIIKAVDAGKIPQPKPGVVKSVNDAIWMDI